MRSFAKEDAACERYEAAQGKVLKEGLKSAVAGGGIVSEPPSGSGSPPLLMPTIAFSSESHNNHPTGSVCVVGGGGRAWEDVWPSVCVHVFAPCKVDCVCGSDYMYWYMCAHANIQPLFCLPNSTCCDGKTCVSDCKTVFDVMAGLSSLGAVGFALSSRADSLFSF